MQSLLAKAQAVTGWSDDRLSVIVGMPRSTVQAYRSGRLPEYLDGMQIKALVDAVRLHRDQLDQGLAELELLS